MQKLNLSDCKLKAEINNVINALGSNQCLQHLDISGNGMGDGGARLLAKALQINTRLKTLNLDRNGISLQVINKFKKMAGYWYLRYQPKAQASLSS